MLDTLTNPVLLFFLVNIDAGSYLRMTPEKALAKAEKEKKDLYLQDCLNDTELSREEFRDNLRRRYGLMPQDIPATCNGCGKKFSIERALSCPKGVLVLARHDNAAKDWGALGAWALVPSAITYVPKINSSTVQGERTGDEALQDVSERYL